MKQVTIDFEEDLYEYLEKRAKEQRREVSAELNTILDALRGPKPGSKKAVYFRSKQS